MAKENNIPTEWVLPFDSLTLMASLLKYDDGQEAFRRHFKICDHSQKLNEFYQLVLKLNRYNSKKNMPKFHSQRKILIQAPDGIRIGKFCFRWKKKL